MKIRFNLGLIGAMAAMGTALSMGAHAPIGFGSPWQLTPSAIKTVTLADAKPIQLLWQPDNATQVGKTLSQMLETATATARRLPNSAHATFFAYMGPAVLTVTTTTGSKVDIYPLYALERTGKNSYAIRYQAETVVFKSGETVEYLHDPSLYHWLTQSQWQHAFHEETSPTNVPSSSLPGPDWT